MAVDKNLPNDPDHDRVKLDIEPNEREVELQEETTKGPIEINQTEDGGVEVDRFVGVLPKDKVIERIS